MKNDGNLEYNVRVTDIFRIILAFFHRMSMFVRFSVKYFFITATDNLFAILFQGLQALT